MKKRVLITSTLLVLIAASALFFFDAHHNLLSNSLNEQKKIEEFDNEERPDEDISEEEKVVNQRRIERYIASKATFKNNSKSSSYANGQITGTWEQFKFLTYNGSPYGFRTKGSVYDQENDVLYAIMEPGHLWKINRNPSDDSDTDWEIMNHKEDFTTSYIEGLNKADGSFRMIRSNDYRMQYSDDEGRSWVNATGVQSLQKSYEGALIKKDNANRIFILLKTSTSNVQVYVSDDNGVSYSPISTSFNPGSYYVKLFRVHNSESVFLAAFDYSNSKVSIYEHGVDDSNFSLVNTSTSTFVSLDNIFGTYHDGNYHFYVGTKYTHIYHTSDKGASWSLNQIVSESGNTNCREVHPTKPNVLFRGYLDVYVSANSGASFSNFGHRLGWDVHHMKFYKRKDGSDFFFLGKDFGCYISDNPEVWSDYTSLNNKSTAQMCYDADHGQNYYSSFTANQDRGTVGFRNNTNESKTEDVRTTDGLRVSLANNDASVWTWMYFGTIYHKSNFAAENSSLTNIGWPGTKWWAAPMIPSPNKNEDAVYIAAGNKLKKLTFNPVQNSIIKTEHYFDFLDETGNEITGFGYSNINTNRWYVSVKNGIFMYSEDGGQTFNSSSYSGVKPTANDASNNYQKNQHVIKASDIDENTVYYAGVGRVFLISKDGGKTFTNHTNGLDIYRMRDFDLSADEKFIYAACGTGGIWVYSVDDDKWYEMNDEAVPNVDFTDVEFIDKQNVVKFATYGSGILSFKISGQNQSIAYPDNLTADVTSERVVNLQWEDNSDNEDEFIVERTLNGVFTEVGRVSANQTTYSDSDFAINGETVQYRVKAVNATDESYFSNYSMVKVLPEGAVSKSGWSLVSVDSEDYVNPQLGVYAFDDNPNTFWFTQWSGGQPPYPHELVIDMNETNTFIGFSYMPRQDGKNDGTIEDFEFYISSDNVSWTKVKSGTWANGTTTMKEEYFGESQIARYIKLVGLSGYNGTNFASCAELSILTKHAEPKTPNAPQFVQVGRLSDTQIELIWMDKSNDENGFVVEQFVNDAFTPIYTSGQNITTYKIFNTDKDETYWFRVKAFNSVGDSEYSEILRIGNDEFPTGINENWINDENIRVYPNPVINEINVEYNSENLFTEWKLYNMLGSVVKQGNISDYQTKVKILAPNLKTGSYVLHFHGKKGDFSKMIFKK